MDWYKKLEINQKINLKEMAKVISGIEWKHLVFFFGMEDAIELLRNKLEQEGFEV